MRRALLAALALAALSASATEIRAPLQRIDRRTWRIFGVPATATATSDVAGSLFTFAPVGGTGMGAACACANPTATGGTVSFTRASSGYCTKGNTLASIANGDLVKCATDQARVMPGGDGTGALGVLVEDDHQNILLQSSAFDDAAWTLEHVVQPVPTVTANAGVAPDGNSTADRIQFPATGAGEDSAIRQDTAAGGTYSAGVYIKGFGGTSGTVDFCTYDGGAWQCTACNFVGSAWTRCVHENYSANTYWLLGNAGFRSGNAHVANDVLVWGGDFQPYTKLFSHVDTTSAAVTYSKDALTATLTTVGSLIDVTATTQTLSTITNGAGIFSLEWAASDSYVRASAPAGVNPNLRCNFRYAGTDHNKDGATAMGTNSSVVTRCYRDATQYATCVNGTCATTTGQLLIEQGSATIYMGRAGTERIGGVISQVTVTGTAGPSTAWIGDSLSTVVYGDAPGRYALEATRTVNNYAVAGTGYVFNGAEIQAQWIAHDVSTNTRLVAEGGINDIRNDVTGANLSTAVQSFLNGVLAEGKTLIVLNLAPFGANASWTSGRQTQLVAYNSALATWCAAHPAAVCVDTYTLLSAGGGSPQNLNAAYDSGDGLHWNGAGAQAVADQVFAQAP